MTFNLNYGNGVISLPKSVVNSLARATENDLKILVCLSAYQHLSFEDAKNIIVSQCGFSSTEFDAAIAFWRGADILIFAENSQNDEQIPVVKKKILQDDKMPSYTGEEIQKICEEKPDIRILVDSSQQIIGKIFTHTEASEIIALSHYLGLDTEYIITLCAYCKKQEKASVRYISKTACALFDDGITTPAQLNIYIKNQEKKKTAEYKIRKLFGIGERALTKKENEYIGIWTINFETPFELIERAYEITMDNGVKKSPMSYMNKILESWHMQGIKTLDGVDSLNQKHNESSAQAHTPSFEVDDFLAAAIARGEKKAKKN